MNSETSTALAGTTFVDVGERTRLPDSIPGLDFENLALEM